VSDAKLGVSQKRPTILDLEIFVSTTLGDSPDAFDMKIRIPLLCVIIFAVITLVLEPIAQAVVPPPDGGYPGGNTAEGQGALFSLTTGTFNTAVGFFALKRRCGR
jgi:hypothetical protein